jgi:hypothetical protein
MSSPAPAPAGPSALIDTRTGEVLNLDTLELAHWQPAELAGLRDRLGEVKRMIDATLVDVDSELVAELDRANTRTGRFGDWEVETEAPLVTVWDKPRLGIALEALKAAGKITPAAAAAALEAQPVEFKPRARELNKLLGHADAEVIAAVDACRHAEPRNRRRVTVRRATSAKRRLKGAHEPQEGTQWPNP